jgi:hypothetical protein
VAAEFSHLPVARLRGKVQRRGPLLHPPPATPSVQCAGVKRCTSCESRVSRRDREWSLNDGQILNARVERVHASWATMSVGDFAPRGSPRRRVPQLGGERQPPPYVPSPRQDAGACTPPRLYYLTRRPARGGTPRVAGHCRLPPAAAPARCSTAARLASQLPAPSSNPPCPKQLGFRDS